MKPIERILVATDLSSCAGSAADVAAELALQVNAAVDVVTVVDTLPLGEAYGDASYRAERIAVIHDEARQKAAAFADHHFKGIKSVKVHVRDGTTSKEIVQAAQDLGSDLIVVGTHGRTGLAHLVIGSIAEKVVRSSAVPVLTVRGTE